MPPERIFVGFGSNLGDREDNLHRALMALKDRMDLAVASSLYETEPMYLRNQPMFLNAVAEFAGPSMEPENLMGLIRQVEVDLGRVRIEKYGPRTLDLDVLFFGNRVIHTDSLKIPHPLIQERPFVLIPLAEIASDFVHPLYRVTIGKLVDNSLKKPIKKLNRKLT
jgi:2-amino-4-hydroxy-6-hydroxymethyldihydropteridine diphosphokinase